MKTRPASSGGPPISGATPAPERPIKLLAFMEATTVTGPAKNLIGFCQQARNVREDSAGFAHIETAIATYMRGNEHPVEPGIDPSRKSPNEFVAAARAAGIDVELIHERFRFDHHVLRELRALVQRYSPDIIQTHHVKSHFLMRLSGLWRQYPWVAFHHGYTTPDLKMRVYNVLDRWSLRTAERVVTVSASFAGVLERLGISRQRIRVVPNSIDAGRFPKGSPEDSAALKLQLGIESQDRVALAVGRLSREKGHLDLVAAMARLRETNPEIQCKLVLVGDGPDRDRIVRCVDASGLHRDVILVGQVGDVSRYYSMADVFVLPSHSEGSSNALLEAMALGVPVVATAVGGIPEHVVHGESSLLVPPHRAETLAEAIRQVLVDSKLANRLAERAQAAIEGRYTPQARLQSLLAIYRELIPAPRASSSSAI